jgi:hypothetical protein
LCGWVGSGQRCCWPLNADPLGGAVHLGELAEQISASSSAPIVQQLAKVLRDWKSDDASVEQLRESVERYIGNSWIESTGEHELVYGLWSKFRDEAIVPIGGLTMNERLYWFDLLAQFDACETEDDRARFYSKLLASP